MVAPPRIDSDPAETVTFPAFPASLPAR